MIHGLILSAAVLVICWASALLLARYLRTKL